MAKTFKRVCIEDYDIVALDGGHFRVERAKEYITGPERDDGTLTVFSRYWVNVPARIFAGEVMFT
jgi:hypothetical protein